jgi:glyoxylase-like metal-dependent hydrolase (beta-lactamase superfamily II)
MKPGRIFTALTATLLAATAQAATPAAPVQLWRLDCGKIVAFDLDEFSDTRAYVGQHKDLTASCYLIRHGDTWMLWDTGLPKALLNHVPDPRQGLDATLTVTIVDQLAKLGLKPERISLVGISHEHFDHTGQAADFPQAKLLMGKGDIDDMRGPNAEEGKPLTHWLGGGGALEPVVGDKDIFGDGSVVMLDLPGHTPGHHGLLVKLQHKGYVLLSGDTAHFTQNYETGGVPQFNSNRADTLASLDRFKKLAANLHATVIIQHEPADIAKLPAFPKAAD